MLDIITASSTDPWYRNIILTARDATGNINFDEISDGLATRLTQERYVPEGEALHIQRELLANVLDFFVSTRVLTRTLDERYSLSTVASKAFDAVSHRPEWSRVSP